MKEFIMCELLWWSIFRRWENKGRFFEASPPSPVPETSASVHSPFRKFPSCHLIFAVWCFRMEETGRIGPVMLTVLCDWNRGASQCIKWCSFSKIRHSSFYSRRILADPDPYELSQTFSTLSFWYAWLWSSLRVIERGRSSLRQSNIENGCSAHSGKIYGIPIRIALALEWSRFIVRALHRHRDYVLCQLWHVVVIVHFAIQTTVLHNNL